MSTPKVAGLVQTSASAIDADCEEEDGDWRDAQGLANLPLMWQGNEISWFENCQAGAGVIALCIGHLPCML